VRCQGPLELYIHQAEDPPSKVEILFFIYLLFYSIPEVSKRQLNFLYFIMHIFHGNISVYKLFEVFFIEIESDMCYVCVRRIWSGRANPAPAAISPTTHRE